DGVYAAYARIEGPTLGDDPAPSRPCPAACHIGPNVTFGEQVRKVEAHLLDFEGELYGRTVELDLLERLRPTRPFAGLDDLLAQIRADVDRTRIICAREGLVSTNR